MHSNDQTPANRSTRREIDVENPLGGDATSILLVEDNPGDARLIEEMLQMKGGLLGRDTDVSRGFEIDHVEKLSDAISTVASEDVDIVLLDLMLPDSRGEETLDEMLARTRDLPIIVMTGLNDRDFGVDAVKRGAQDFLVKGEFDGELLVRTIKYAIERKKNERQLAARTEELEILTRILHHDIRNDMNIVRGMIRLGMDEENPDESFETALSNVEHAIETTETVEPLLESITGEEELDLEPIPLRETLGDEIRKLESSYPDTTVHPPADPDEADDGVDVVGGDDSGPDAVLANPLLSSVFGNLLNNAVQHNDTETPEIDVSVEIDRAEDRARVALADDGPGIPEERRDALFDQAAAGRRSSDTGLGLYLVDRLVTEYDGDVWVGDSDLGGARFVVELPLA
jgi:signal transduction histidine kinase